VNDSWEDWFELVEVVIWVAGKVEMQR
jgi:hypothetical protein